MVDDQQISEAPHPVRVHHLPGRDRPYRLPLGRADEHALRLDTGRTPWSAETPGEFPGDRQAQLAAQRREPRAAAAFRGALDAAVDELADAAHQAREARLVGAQRLDLLAPGADLGRGAIELAALLAPLGEHALAVGAARALHR